MGVVKERMSNLKKLKQLLFCTFAALFLMPQMSFSLQNAYFEHFRVSNGLSHYSVNSLYQDENGLVWIGTRDGLNCFDGNEITVYRQIDNDSTALFGNNIRSVCGDKKGNLFMQCKSGVVVFDLKTEKFKTLRRQNVSTIVYGKERLWFASTDSIYSYEPEKDKLQLYMTFSDNQLRISSILETPDQLLYVATNSMGLCVFDKNKRSVKQFNISSVISLYEDSKKNVWVCTRYDGLYKIDYSGNVIRYQHDPLDKESIPDNFVRTICEDDFGNYWIGSYAGLCKLNVEKDKFVLYRYEKQISHGLSNSSVWSIVKDSQGTLWIGTYFGGIDLFNPKYSIYNYYSAYDNQPYSLSNPVVGRIIEEKNGNLWIATDGGGINYFDRDKGTFTSYQSSEKNQNSLSANTIKSLWLDEKRGNLWIGTHMGGLNKFNLETHKVTIFKHDPLNKKSIPHNNVREIFHRNDTLFLATQNSIGLFDLQTETCTTLEFTGDFDLSNRELTDLTIDSKNRMWYTYSNNIFCMDMGSKEVRKYKLNNNALIFFEDSKKRIWVGTDGAGIYLYDEKTKEFTNPEYFNQYLLSKYVIDIKESKNGYFYVSTNDGLLVVDNDFNSSQLLNTAIGFPLEALNEKSLHITSKSEIFVGGINGMVSFLEKDLNIPRSGYSVNVTGIRINNKKIIPDRQSIINESLPYISEITLKPKHSIISIFFSTTNYINVLKTDVQYQLVGFDKEWIDADYKQNITYTNLNPGKYILKIRGKMPTSEGIYPEKSIVITMLPPFYKTSIAYILYAVLIIVLSVSLIKFYTSKIKLRTSLEYEKREKKHIEELNQSKLRFFTNISHEFRTPLTLIINQIEIIFQMGNIPQSIYGRLLNVMRNANRMKKLVTELIDFRKYEQGFMELSVSEYNLIRFLDEIYLSFKELAQTRKINYTFEYKSDDLVIWFDADQLEKTFYNLISNAFKYTPDNGTITIRIEEINFSIIVSVTDSGIGIEQSSLNKVFDRFYQVENKTIEWGGSGIGLALAKSIVELHHGEIGVESEVNVGSRFWVKLLMGDNHFTEGQKKTAHKKDLECLLDSDFPDGKFIDEIIQSQKNSESLNSTILIIEDNEELLKTLASIFQPIYKVVTAKDGSDGFDQAIAQQPDIILSDVMMPKMSGVELCSKLKSNFETSHIPIVLLTAQSAADYIVQGLLTGADDYIVKPFNLKILVTRCNNLVNSRKLLQKKFALQPQVEPQLIATNSIDQKLLERATDIVEKNIDNPGFDVNMFASELWLSRTNLFNKLKGITGQTPNDFIINIRLKKSLYLLINSEDLPVADIAVQVGFGSTSYFIKKFHQLYGVTPSQYRSASFTKKSEVKQV